MNHPFNRSGQFSCLAAVLLAVFVSPGRGNAQDPVTVSQQVRETENRLLRQADENIEKYRKGDVLITFLDMSGKAVPNARVSIEQTSHDFLFGCIIFDFIRNENTYKMDLFKERYKKIFNLAVFPFYWPGYESTQGMPAWADMLPTIEWCRSNGITTKGHPLVWACRSGTPRWLNGYREEQTEDLLKARVMNIVGGFKGRIELFDVVNEPVNVKTWEHKISTFDEENDWGVEDPVPEIADYVEKALNWAHSANPDATLLINEYRTISDKHVRERYNELLAELTRRHAPISGLGIQAHEPRQEWFNPQELWDDFDLLSQYGYPIHITELHPQSSGVNITGGWRTGEWTPQAQMEFTEQFVRLCFGHPAVASINWWGFSDRNIWLPGGGLVDEEYNPKPVYTMLDKLINESWSTRLSSDTDKKGTVSFRGFFGNYNIRLTTTDGKSQVFRVHVNKNEENKWIFTFGN